MRSAAAVAAIVDTHRRFDGRVVYRQVPTGLAGQPRPALWRPTRRPWRWNDAFPTLYTALSLEVAYAERLKRTGAAPVRLVVGVADVSIGRTLDLTDPSVLVRLRVRVADLVADDHTVTRALGTAFYQAGITGLLVPAAIVTTRASIRGSGSYATGAPRSTQRRQRARTWSSFDPIEGKETVGASAWPSALCVRSPGWRPGPPSQSP